MKLQAQYQTLCLIKMRLPFLSVPTQPANRPIPLIPATCPA